MIIRNGFVQRLTPDAEVTYDEHGYPVVGQGSTEEIPAIPCQWEQITQDRLATSSEGSAYSKLSYRILTETPIDSDFILLCNRDGDELGRFAVKTKEELFAVGLYRLTV